MKVKRSRWIGKFLGISHRSRPFHVYRGHNIGYAYMWQLASKFGKRRDWLLQTIAFTVKTMIVWEFGSTMFSLTTTAASQSTGPAVHGVTTRSRPLESPVSFYEADSTTILTRLFPFSRAPPFSSELTRTFSCWNSSTVTPPLS